MLPDENTADAPIDYASENIDFELANEAAVTQWLLLLSESEDADIEALSYIFCDDEYLLQMNQEYLDHDTYTDVITFDYSEEEGIIEGDIFISIDRIKENAEQLKVSFTDELHRVMAHGLLHLLGYSDKTEEAQQEMRQKEDKCLSLRSF
ncbi:MAG: rRNA maturation RNase YbeY [Proteobacteria bacterium]|nr:MAG: rRNA maturation RNase YbeY [Pseudomonadota bacterium]